MSEQPIQHRVAIVGDSYCASFRYRTHPPGGRTHQNYDSKTPTWVDLVLDRYNDCVDVHGYGGRSWWYSWSKFYDFWHYRFDELDAAIFCHTGYSRINNAWNDALCLMPTYSSVDLPSAVNDSELNKAHTLYYKHIHDQEFYTFAQLGYAYAIARLLGHIKTVHFLCFEQPPEFVAALPGTVYTTPLFDISNSINAPRDIIDELPNHFTPEINRAFGQLVIDAVENYQPGHRPIDLTQFGLQ